MLVALALFLIAFALFCIAIGIDGLRDVIKEFLEELEEE